MSVSYEIFLYFDLKPAFRLIVKYLPADFGHLAVLLQNGENKHTICSGTKACVIGFLACTPLLWLSASVSLYPSVFLQ
jgi:hypothetical protein